MKLFIQIKDGLPFEHPIILENFIQAFPDIDVNNLPSNFAYFEKVDAPVPESEYQKVVLNYAWSGEIVKEAWEIVDMTDEERNEVDKKKAEIAEERARFMLENSIIEVTRV